LRDTPVRLSDAQIAILISKLPGSRDELITGHLRLLKYLVSRSRRLYGGDSGDLVSAATFALVKGVERVARGEKVLTDGNITGYLHKRMWGAIRNEQCNKSVFGPSVRTLFRKSAKGEPNDLKRNPDYSDVGGRLDPAITEMENLEFTRSLLKTDLEYRVFELRYQGLSDAEIGDMLNMSARSVYRIRYEIGKRFLEIGYDS
jgi:DNA-directed RNA polymerase specialized sigma subunit